MIKKLIVCMTAVVLSAGLLMAHGDELTGTVKSIDKGTITITDKDKKDVPVMLEAKTKYMLGTKAAKMTDIKVGAKVAIDATMDTKMKMFVAESVTGPAAPAAAKASTAAAKPAAPKAAATTAKPATTPAAPAAAKATPAPAPVK